MRFRLCAVIGTLLLLTVCGTGSAEGLAATCTECTEGGNVWIVGPLCEETCVEPPSGTQRNASVWRSNATTPDECNTLRKCKQRTLFTHTLQTCSHTLTHAHRHAGGRDARRQL